MVSFILQLSEMFNDNGQQPWYNFPRYTANNIVKKFKQANYKVLKRI